MNRLDLLRQHVDVAHSRGLEVGPLVSPVVTPELGKIFYADYCSTDELRKKYVDDPTIDEDQIPPVDFVWGTLTLAEAAAAEMPFDYVVAAHVVEHVPDLVGWLREVADVLRPGGQLLLVIPDRRFSFDARRRQSSMAELVDAYLLHLRRPAIRACFDHFSRFINVDAGARWNGEPGYDQSAPINLLHGWEVAQLVAQSDDYLDTHCWVFSDAEFVELIGELTQLNLVDFKFVSYLPTERGQLEFFVVLERFDDALSPQAKAAAGMAALPSTGRTGSDDTPHGSAGRGTAAVTGAGTLSARELAFIQGKRRAMTKLRTLAHRLARRR